MTGHPHQSGTPYADGSAERSIRCVCCGVELEPNVGVRLCMTCFASATVRGRGDVLYCTAHDRTYNPTEVTQ